MKLSILYYPHREGHNSIFPLLAYRKNLLDENIEYNLFTKVSDFLASVSDAWIISGISLPKLLNKNGKSQAEFLKICQLRNIPLIYLAGSDSTGPFDHEIIDAVDMFLSRQLVKDKSYYIKSHRRHHFRDTYFLSHSFKNEADFPMVSYSEHQVKKMGLYWNLGLIDWKTQTSSKLKKYLNIWKRNKTFPIWDKGKNLEERNLDLMFRGNLFLNNHDACRLHRLQTYRVYQKKALKYKTPSEGLISHEKYMKELESVRICLSPFGWGEVCYRDFESFQARTLLLKPDMSHLETWPNFYSSETMISYNWNADDLSNKIDFILSNPKVFQEVADFGYENFINNTIGDDAGYNFVFFLKEQLLKSIHNFSSRVNK